MREYQRLLAPLIVDNPWSGQTLPNGTTTSLFSQLKSELQVCYSLTRISQLEFPPMRSSWALGEPSSAAILIKVNPEKTNTLCILMQSFESLGTSDENRSLKDILALGPSEKLTRSGNDQLWRLSQFLHFQLQICRQATTSDFSIDLLKNKSHHIGSGSWTSSSQNLEELNNLLMMYQALIGTMRNNYSIITSLKDFLNHHRDRITCWPRLNPEDESSVIYSDSIYRIMEITSNLQR